jgi:hypothetical protein
VQPVELELDLRPHAGNASPTPAITASAPAIDALFQRFMIKPPDVR